MVLLKVVTAMLVALISVARFQTSMFQNYQLPLCVHVQKTHPLSVIGWKTVHVDFEWLVVTFIFEYDLRA